MTKVVLGSGDEADLYTLEQGEIACTDDTQEIWMGTSVGNVRVGGANTNMKTKPVSSKSIGPGIGNKKYCHIDSGNAPAEILGIEIAGIVGYAWCIDLYIPEVDGIITLQPGDKRDSHPQLVTHTTGGHIQRYGMPYNSFLDFTNDGGGPQTAGPFVITYICANDLVVTWET